MKMMVCRLMVLGLMVLVGSALAQSELTPAGTSIENQAEASYIDSAGQPQTVTSNTVITVVQQVFALTITPNGLSEDTPGQTLLGVVGSTVFFEYCVSNAGNGVDTINLSVAQGVNDSFNFLNPQFFLDANQDGQPDSATPITSVTLAAGEGVCIVLGVTIPADAGNDVFGNINAVGTSQGDPAVTDNDNWARAVSRTLAALTLDKSADPSGNVSPGAVISYTVSGANQGGSSPFALSNVVTVDGTALSGVLITDFIPPAAPSGPGLVYQAGSLSGSATVAATNPAPTLIYSTNGGGTWTATEPSPASSVNAVGLLIQGSGQFNTADNPVFNYTLSFAVQVPGNAPSGSSYSNVATLLYDADGDAVAETVTSPAAVTAIDSAFSVILGPLGFPAGNAPGDSYSQGSYTVTRTGDSQTVATGFSGQTVTFAQTVENTGNIVDSYALSVTPPAGFPGTVSVTDLEGNPITSITVAAEASQVFLVNITLPDAFASGAPLEFGVTASSSNAAGVTDSTSNVISQVVSGFGVSVGNNPDLSATTPPSDASVDVAAVPGDTVSFALKLQNSGQNPDSYDLSSTLPGGWSALFYADTTCDGVPDGAPISNTGTIAAGAITCLVVEVSVPLGTAPNSYDVTLTATGQTTPGISDSITNTVTVGEVVDFVFAADQALTTNPGSTVTYTHTVTNNSNATATVEIAAFSSGQPGWVYQYSLDNVTFVPALTDTQSFTVAPNGGTQLVYVQVTIPASAPNGSSEAATLTANATFPGGGSGSASVTDTTTVAAGILALSKTVDNDTAIPGDTLTYTIVAENTGDGNLTNVVISDPIPAFTTFVSVGATSSVPGGVVLYSTDGSNWSPSPPTTVATGGAIFVGVDTNGDTTVTAADTLPPGATITVTLVVTVQ